MADLKWCGSFTHDFCLLSTQWIVNQVDRWQSDSTGSMAYTQEITWSTLCQFWIFENLIQNIFLSN
jgi:hypothetical protein